MDWPGEPEYCVGYDLPLRCASGVAENLHKPSRVVPPLPHRARSYAHAHGILAACSSSRTSRVSTRRSPTGCGPRASRSSRRTTAPARSRRRRPEPDLVVLDVMLPGFDGLEVCRRIQAERPVPVLMLTARDDETDLLVGLGGRRGRLPDQAVLACASWSARVQRPAAPGRAGRRARRAAGGPTRRRRPGDRHGGATGGRGGRGGAPHPDRVRPAGPPGGRAGRRCCTRERLLADVWGWAERLGHPHRRQPREGAARQARRRPDPHRARRRLRAGGRPGVCSPGARCSTGPLDQGEARASWSPPAWSWRWSSASSATTRACRCCSPSRSPSRWRSASTQLLAVGMTSPLREMTAAARPMARGDYRGRVRADLARRGGRAGPRVQPDGRRPGRRRPAAARADRERLARAAYPARRRCSACWRTSSTACRRAGPGARCGPRWPDRAARPTWSPTCSTCPGSTPASRRCDLRRRRRRGAPGRDASPRLGAGRSRRCVASASTSPTAHGAGRPRPAPPAGRRTCSTTPSGTVPTAAPSGSRAAATGGPAGASRSPTRVPASRRRTASGSSSGSDPAASGSRRRRHRPRPRHRPLGGRPARRHRPLRRPARWDHGRPAPRRPPARPATEPTRARRTQSRSPSPPCTPEVAMSETPSPAPTAAVDAPPVGRPPLRPLLARRTRAPGRARGAGRARRRRAGRACCCPYRDLGLAAFLVLRRGRRRTVAWAAKHRRDPFTLTLPGRWRPSARCRSCLLDARVDRGPVPAWRVSSASVAGRDRRRVGCSSSSSPGVAWPLAAAARPVPWLGRSVSGVLGTGPGTAGPASRRVVGARRCWSSGCCSSPRTPSSRAGPDDLRPGPHRARPRFSGLFVGVFVRWCDARRCLPRPEPAQRLRRPGTDAPAAGGAPLRVAGASAARRRRCSRSSSPRRRPCCSAATTTSQRTTGPDLRRLRAPGLRPAHRGDAADAARGLGGLPPGRPGAGRPALDARSLSGLLCALTLVVVVSALHRMHLYQQAYGFTQARLTVDVFEGWLGVVVLAVALSGLVRWGAWVPRFALVTGVVGLLGHRGDQPRRLIARHNIERYEDDRQDRRRLPRHPVRRRRTRPGAPLPEPLRSQALATRVPADDDWLAWNLGRARAEDSLAPG